MDQVARLKEEIQLLKEEVETEKLRAHLAEVALSSTRDKLSQEYVKVESLLSHVERCLRIHKGFGFFCPCYGCAK